MNISIFKAYATTLSAALLLTACSLEHNDDPQEPSEAIPQVTVQLRQLIEDKQITPLERSTNIPYPDERLPQLGKQLFFSKALSGNMDTACASCHHPNLGGSDNIPLPIGADAVAPDLLGPGRLHNSQAPHHDGGPTVPRNSPSTLNVAFYQQAIFHDGRLENLNQQPAIGGVTDAIRTPDSEFNSPDIHAGTTLAAAQARFPITSKEEMRGFQFVANGSNQQLRQQLVERLRGNTPELPGNGWLSEFQLAFEQPQGTAADLITEANIFHAIGEYERSQVLIDNPWSAFLAGDNDAISESAQRGAQLFYQTAAEGGFNCAGCHSGSRFTDEQYHVIGLPQIGRGKGDGPTGDNDFGRFRETGQEIDKYAFRTSHLLNITRTGPYGHNGAYLTLEGMVRHHLNPENALLNYDPQIQPGIQTENWADNSYSILIRLKFLQNNGLSKLQPFIYEQQHIDDLLAFLSALEDPCTAEPQCMNQWVPNADDSDPDGLRLIGYDQNGDLL